MSESMTKIEFESLAMAAVASGDEAQVRDLANEARRAREREAALQAKDVLVSLCLRKAEEENQRMRTALVEARAWIAAERSEPMCREMLGVIDKALAGTESKS